MNIPSFGCTCLSAAPHSRKRPGSGIGARCSVVSRRAYLSRGSSFDHVVGAAKNRWRDRHAERLGGLEIDHQLEPRRSLDRQVGRAGTGGNPADIDPDLTIRA
jgi:hypothetical protein